MGWVILNSFRKTTIGKAMMAVISTTIVGVLLLIIMVLISFIGEDENIIEQVERPKVVYLNPPSDRIDLGKLKPSEDGRYSTPYDGYQDPKQKEMAKEILSIYNLAVQREETLLNRYGDKKGLMEFLFGIHLTESDTYSNRQSVEKTTTYIPLNMVKWEEYSWAGSSSKVTTEEGLLMNFTNYSWKDFYNKYMTDNPSNTTPTSSKHPLYTSGLHYGSLRSYTGALGPMQMQPTSWFANSYVTHRSSNGLGFDHITDIPNYITNSIVGNGTGYRAKNFFDDKDYADIFRYPDQVLGVLGWIPSTMRVSNSTFKRYDMDTSDLDVVRLHVAGSYLMGDGGFMLALGGKGVYMETPVDSTGHPNKEEFSKEIAHKITEDMLKIVRDTSENGTWKKVFSIYQQSRGHNINEWEEIARGFEKLGWKMDMQGSVGSRRMKYDFKYKDAQGIERTYTYSTRQEYLMYPLRMYFQGKAWYEFINGIAYGGKDEPSLVMRNNLRSFTYNYMTESDGRMKIDMEIRDKAVSKDPYNAIGYKGPYPIYDQAGDFMKKHWFYKGTKNSKPETFSESACTVFTMSSLANGLGVPNSILSKLDHNNNGAVSPIEWWVRGKMVAFGRSYYDTTQYPTSNQVIQLESIRSLLSNVGYEVIPIHQSNSKDNKELIERLKQGIPSHVRIKGGRLIPGYYPKESKLNIDYNKFDMDNLDNYEYLSGGMALSNAGGQHSVLAVDVKNINGEDYISIVNSSHHHRSAKYDSNLVWFKASDLLKDDYPNSYSIVGVKGDLTWKPTPADTIISVPKEDLYEYVGVNPLDIINAITNVEVEPDDQYTMKLAPLATAPLNNNGTVTVALPDKYETRSVGRDTLLITAGVEGKSKVIVEISNVLNPRSNSVGSIGEETVLFDLPLGQKAIVQIGNIRENGEIIYDVFYDILD